MLNNNPYDNNNFYEVGKQDEFQIPEHHEKPKRKNNNWKKLGKKAGAIVLSAVLFGGTAGMVFEGVSSLAGSDGQPAVNSEKDSSKVNLVTASTAGATDTSDNGNLSVSQVAEAVMPSVVSITNKSVKEVQDYYGMFGFGGPGQQAETESAGSGIIIGQNDKELLMVSNNHVVENASTLTVSFTDGSAAEAQVKGTDANNDLAVIAVPLESISEETMSKIKVATIGNSESLRVGEQVVAIGNALGYGQSVTTGIVSAMGRQIEEKQDSPSLIQTDAAINPGNSGGALINMKGEVIGINSAKFASTEIEGMGYAIPIDTASPIVEDLMNRVTREKVDESKTASIGIGGEDVTSQVQEMYGFPSGIYIANVEEGSGAEKAGIKSGNIITKFDGTDVSSVSQLKSLLQYYEAGETVEITLKAADNGEYKEVTVNVTLDAAQNDTQETQEANEGMQEGVQKGMQEWGNSYGR